MYKAITVDFPESTYAPSSVYKAVLYQKVYEHEMMVLTFKDWDITYDTIRPGTPIQAKIYGTKTNRDFVGYIHHIEPTSSPGTSFTDVVCIGGSFPMKQASQKIYRNYTANQVIKDMCVKHGLSFYGIPHPRIFDQIAHAGYTDWQMAVRLAKQIGHTLRAENTEIYFEPILHDYTKYRAEAFRYTMRDAHRPEGSTLYSFRPLIGESLEFDGDMKAAVAVSGVDRASKSTVAHTKQQRNLKTKSKAQDEFFDRFDSLVVASNSTVAKQESEAAEARNSFPYRGTATMLGEPNIRPNIPVYLDGVGSTYSGYWTVLGAEHTIVETERNVYTYTTTVTIGSDSVGLATRWVDGSAIDGPATRPCRTIKPGVRQTKVKPKSKLASKGTKSNARNMGSFGKIGNRTKVTKNVKVPGVWKTANPTPTVAFVQKTTKSATVANRVRDRAAR